MARLDSIEAAAEKIYLIAAGDADFISGSVRLGFGQKYQSDVGQLSGFFGAGNNRAEHDERKLHEHNDGTRRARLSQKFGRIFECADRAGVIRYRENFIGSCAGVNLDDADIGRGDNFRREFGIFFRAAEFFYRRGTELDNFCERVLLRGVESSDV